MKRFLFISHGIPPKAVSRLEIMLAKPAKLIKILYITTPANTYPPSAVWIAEAKNDIKKYGFKMQELDIEKIDKAEIQKLINQYDVVWVSGGNTFYFLYWSKKVGLKKMLLKFLQNGGVYAGESAGVVCQIKDLEPIKWADKSEKAPKLVTTGMQLTNLVIIPHWGVPKYQPVLNKIKTYYENKGIKPYLLKDKQAIIVENRKIEIL